ncbi:MAG: DedA family protein [Solirubrobacteraceae bacterium]
MLLAALIDVAQNLGYPVLFLLVGAESMGVPVPGETALIVGGIAANQGRLSIAAVIAVAAAAAIIGDNVGFWIGRRGGRALLERPGPFEAGRRRVIEVGDPFFERHGAKAVFLGRWVLGLRVWAAWLAGASEMRWPTFLVWNAAGGICWATSIGLAVYFGGKAVEHTIATAGVYGAILVAVLAVAALIWHQRHRRNTGSR